MPADAEALPGRITAVVRDGELLLTLHGEVDLSLRERLRVLSALAIERSRP